jgi:hypothetical protein
MNQIELSNIELKSLKILLEYLSNSEEKHYEESDKNEQNNHIYKHTIRIKSALKIKDIL